jgi:hypothetical protein
MKSFGVFLFFHFVSLISSLKIPLSKLTTREKQVVNQINGFFGLVGPNLDSKKQSSLYDLFTGDGMIQGVFFDKGNVTFVKHIIQTDKWKIESRIGKITDIPLVSFLFYILQKLIKMPNMLGTANTALIDINKKVFACYERDKPYEIDVDFEKKQVTTLKKQTIPFMTYFSAHSKYNKERKTIDAIEYSMTRQLVTFYELDHEFSYRNKIEFPFVYMPLGHDFYVDEKKIVMIDSPFEIKTNGLLFNKMPVHMNEKKDTYFYVYDKERKERNVYTLKNKGINTFHYAHIEENKDCISIYAPIYDNIEFSNLNLEGKYRCIQIDKKTREVTIEKNHELEGYNLDFPICYDNKIILRNVKDRRINGFVVCEDLRIKKRIFFEERDILGEHQVVTIKNKPYVLFYNLLGGSYFLSLMNLENPKEIIDMEIPEKLELGFHSLFVSS